jgi:acetyl-CoA carboxylase biotin carboxyl carrier protein
MSELPFDPAAIRLLAEILSETGLTEIEIAEQDRRICIKRAPAPITMLAAGAPALAPASMPPVAATPIEPEPEDPAKHPGAVLSPMVGVAYLAPEPGAPNFVTVGQTVEAGQTLLLIEAMKTFNQIKAPKAGTVSRILVATGAPVEFGEPLLIIA